MRGTLRVIGVVAAVLHASMGAALAQTQFNLRFASYAPEGDVFERQIADEYNRGIMGKLGEVMKINQVPPETLSHFRTAAQSVYREAYGELGEEGRAIVDEIVKVSN